MNVKHYVQYSKKKCRAQ